MSVEKNDLSLPELRRLYSMISAFIAEKNLTRSSQLIILFVLLFLGGMLFAPVLHGYWLADDFSWIKALQHYDWREMPKLFLGLWPRQGEYRPLWTVSFVMDLRIWGANVQGFHLTNLIFHLVAAALVWYMVEITVQKNRLAALLSLAFFVLHPIHVQPVAWISARGHILVTIFILSSLIFLRRFQLYGGAGNYTASLVAAIAAFTTQEAAAALPLLLLLQELVYIPNLNLDQFLQILKRQFPFWGLLSLYVAFRIFLFGKLADRLVSSVQQFFFYVYIPNRTLWLSPAGITNAPHVFAEAWMKIFLVLSIAVLLLLPFRFLRSMELKEYTREFFYFAIGWPIITTVVYLGANSERHLYLASIGPCVILGWATARLLTTKGLLPVYASVVSTFLIFAYGWALITGITGFALNNEKSLQIRQEVDTALRRASSDRDAIVVVIPEIPNNEEVLWDYFYPEALQPPFTTESPSVTVIPSFASCHCRLDEWMAQNGSSLALLTHDSTAPIYVVQWDTQHTVFVTRQFNPIDFQNEGYLMSNGSFLGPRKPGEVLILP